MVTLSRKAVHHHTSHCVTGNCMPQSFELPWQQKRLGLDMLFNDFASIQCLFSVRVMVLVADGTYGDIVNTILGRCSNNSLFKIKVLEFNANSPTRRCIDSPGAPTVMSIRSRISRRLQVGNIHIKLITLWRGDSNLVWWFVHAEQHRLPEWIRTVPKGILRILWEANAMQTSLKYS